MWVFANGTKTKIRKEENPLLTHILYIHICINGEGESGAEKDREQNKQAGDLYKEEEWFAQEGL